MSQNQPSDPVVLDQLVYLVLKITVQSDEFNKIVARVAQDARVNPEELRDSFLMRVGL